MTQVADGHPRLLALSEFTDWIQKTDPHADFHLDLVRAAEDVLNGEESPSTDSQMVLADRLERWRYQLINHFSGRLAPMDWDLMDVLDLTSNKIAGRPPRNVRQTRFAVGAHCGSSSGFVCDSTLDWEQIEAQLHATDDLDGLMQRAEALTRKHFGSTTSAVGDDAPTADTTGNAKPRTTVRRMKLYAPLYLSNFCINHCPYCGFRYPHSLERTHLSAETSLQQAEVLWERGFRNVLVVAGDFPQMTTTRYFVEIIRGLRDRGFQVAVEIAAQSTLSYQEMARAGATALTLYQETYDEEAYAEIHFRGSKASFDWRLEAPERAAEAGFRRLGLGVLLGLADPTRDVLAMMRHASYLRKRYPQCRFAFSLPRIHEAPDGFETPYPVDDQLFIRLYCVLRLAFPEADLVLSTREPPELRSRLAKVCITQMSAGSSTAPGGYERSPTEQHDREQFPVVDQRTPAEVVQWLQNSGFEPVWEFI